MENKEVPKISIGIPVYNGEEFLEDALNALLLQTFKDFEIVVGDNASSDRTDEICKSYQKRFLNFLYYRHKENMGAARNYGFVFSKSCGQYFKWAPYDDKIAPDYLERCSLILDNDPSIVIAHSQTVFIDKNGREIGINTDDLTLKHSKAHKRLQKLLKNINLCNPVLGLIRSEALRKSNLIGSFIGSDFILLIELCLLGKFFEIREPLFYRREHSKNVRKLPPEERFKWFNPMYRGRSHRHPTLFLFRKQVEAIYHSPIEPTTKISCMLQIYFWLIRKFRNKLGLLKRDLKLAMGKVLFL